MNAAQALPISDLAAGRGGAEIRGERFGLLTALRIVEKTDNGNLWLLQCDCGRFAVRTLARLRQADRSGQEPQCSECLAQLRSGSWSQRRADSGEKWARMLDATGELYSERSDELHRKQIVAESAEFFGFEPDPDEPRLPLIASMLGSGGAFSGQRAAFFVPISGRARRCALCRQLFSDGFGCLACLSVACLPCVRLELHGACCSDRADWEACMTAERAEDLPKGDPLGKGVTRVVQKHLPDSARRRLVASLRPEKIHRAPPEPRTKQQPRRVVFDWTEFRYESEAGQ